MPMKIIIGVSGASGSLYTARLIHALASQPGETYFIVSPSAIRVFQEEYQTKVSTPNELVDFVMNKYPTESNKNKFIYRKFNDIGCDIASGSNGWDGMVVVPCSMNTMASIHAGIADNLIERCADVSLKERRKLILVPRETPYNRIHLKNMIGLDEAGAIILPASPGLYHNPKTLEELGDFIAGRILQFFGVSLTAYKPWHPDYLKD